MKARLKRDVQVAGSDDPLAAKAVAVVRVRMESRRKTAEVVVGRSFEDGR